MSRLLRAYALILLFPLLISCNQPSNTQNDQEEIRKKAAEATEEVKKGVKELDKDAAAAAQGVKEGWKRDEQNKPQATPTRFHHSKE